MLFRLQTVVKRRKMEQAKVEVKVKRRDSRTHAE
jgi:hypothetical protein